MKSLSVLTFASVALVAMTQHAQAQPAGERIAGSYVCVFKRARSRVAMRRRKPTARLSPPARK